MCQDFIIRPTYLSAVTKTVDGVKQVIEEPKEFGVSLLPSRPDLSDYELELGRSVNFNGYHLYNLYHLDCIDSRTEIYREAMASVPAGKFSDYIYALGKRVYRHGMDTPQS